MNAPTFSSVVAAFAARLEQHPQSILIRLVESAEVTHELSYSALYDGARRAARGLNVHGVKWGERIVVGMSTSVPFFHLYLGALMSGVIPIVVPGPRKRVPVEVYAGHIGLLIGVTDAKLFVADEQAPPELAAHLPVRVATWTQLNVTSGPIEPELSPAPEQLAHLQATSGSTGIPHLAEIRHGNIAANVRAIGQAIRHRDGDVLMSWLPLFHDMGLIGVSYSLLWDCPLVVMDPSGFVRNPLVWPRVMHEFRGTLSPAPNSAFKVCARLGERAGVKDLELSSWRVALCGAEPIHVDTLAHFQRVFGPVGFRPQTMLPVYGLAEATLAATISDVDSPPHVDEIDTAVLQETGRCVTPREVGPRMRNVALGRALPEHEVRIVDADGRTLPPRHAGEVEFRGPSVIQGYWGYEVPDPTLKRPDGFLRTGDLGYLAEDGQLYVTGRQKDIIIANGRNFVPFQIEEEVAAVIRSQLSNGVAAVGIPDPLTNSEGLHLIIESVELPRLDQAREEAAIRERLEQAFGLTGLTIHWKPKGWNPKTTSGKLQRYRCREKLLGERAEP